MIVVQRGLLLAFMRQHTDSGGSLRAWLRDIEAEDWQHFPHLKEHFGTASYVNGHTIFNIRGNRYRLDVRIVYESRLIIVERLGTHEEYDGWTFD